MTDQKTLSVSVGNFSESSGNDAVAEIPENSDNSSEYSERTRMEDSKNDPVRKQAAEVFGSLTAYVQSQISESTLGYKTLDKMNQSAIVKYEGMTEKVREMLSFLGESQEKNSQILMYLEKIDAVYDQILKLEGVVTALDGYTQRLEKQFEKLCGVKH
eukprot:119308_1